MACGQLSWGSRKTPEPLSWSGAARRIKTMDFYLVTVMVIFLETTGGLWGTWL
jgi:hypothetical protein